MPKGSLEYDPKYITPKDKTKSPEAYSAASEVKEGVSPIKDVAKAAEAQALQEKFDKDIGNATKRRKVGGKKHGRKTKRRMTKRRHSK
jgi:hypothetical protein